MYIEMESSNRNYNERIVLILVNKGKLSVERNLQWEIVHIRINL